MIANIATGHDGKYTCDCHRCVKRDPARFHGNSHGDPVQTRFGARGGRTVHLTSRSCGAGAFCGADVGHVFATASGMVGAIRAVKFCKRCVAADAVDIALGLIAFVAWARSTWAGVDVEVARAGLASARKHGIVNLRYGCYRPEGDRTHRWGNFTGASPAVHVACAVELTDENTASTAALIAALSES